MVAHDGIGHQINAEMRYRVCDTRCKPAAAMLPTVTEEECPTGTAGDDVVRATTAVWKGYAASEYHMRDGIQGEEMSNKVCVHCCPCHNSLNLRQLTATAISPASRRTRAWPKRWRTGNELRREMKVKSRASWVYGLYGPLLPISPLLSISHGSCSRTSAMRRFHLAT